jgi:hypothetical protein
MNIAAVEYIDVAGSVKSDLLSLSGNNSHLLPLRHCQSSTRSRSARSFPFLTPHILLLPQGQFNIAIVAKLGTSVIVTVLSGESPVLSCAVLPLLLSRGELFGITAFPA